jgi:DNA-binding MarR family transcriptional regulator
MPRKTDEMINHMLGFNLKAEPMSNEYKPLEVMLIKLLGDKGYTSNIDHKKLLILKKASYEERYAITDGARGMPFNNIIDGLDITRPNLTHLVRELEKKHAVAELLYSNAECMADNHRIRSLTLTPKSERVYVLIRKALLKE